MLLLQPEADINLRYLRENYQFLQSKVGSAKIMGVVKADAYGHGLLPVSKMLAELGMYGFCVALVSEAQELIHGGIDNPILHLGKLSEDQLDVFKTGQVRCTINSIKDIKIIENFGFANKVCIKAHLKVDTGMGRLGVCNYELEDLLNKLSIANHIEIEGLYSHFATAEEENTEYRNLQLERYKEAIYLVKRLLPGIKYFHIANSATILRCSDAYFNMVRPGISLYGVTPFGIPDSNLSPVMTMKAPLTIVKHFKKEDSIGYNRLYVLEKDESIAFVQAGYADGIPVLFSNRGQVEIDQRLYPIIGKVSMDMLSVRYNSSDDVENKNAIFWGGNNTDLRLEVLSDKFKKSPYEFLTGITKRVKKTYID